MQKITRTIVSTLVTVKAVNTETEEITQYVATLPGKINDEAKLLAAVKKEMEQTKYVFVKLIDVQRVDAKYEMPINVFINNANLVNE